MDWAFRKGFLSQALLTHQEAPAFRGRRQALRITGSVRHAERKAAFQPVCNRQTECILEFLSSQAGQKLFEPLSAG
jgi:hypothetical protein